MMLAYISLIIFIVYVSSMIVMFGIPASISDTYYLLERKRRGLGWLFTAFSWSVAFTLLPAWLDVTPLAYQFLPFLAAAGLAFVGAAPQFKLSLTGPVHYVGAAVCCLSAGAWVALSGAWWTLPAAYAAFLAVASLNHNWMFWIEIAAFVSLFLSLSTIV